MICPDAVVLITNAEEADGGLNYENPPDCSLPGTWEQGLNVWTLQRRDLDPGNGDFDCDLAWDH